MADSKGITTESSKPTSTGREEIRAPERYLRPSVDIVETPEGLTILADMPGVTKENLEVGLDNGILTIQGKVNGEPQGEAIYREFSLLPYYRQFQLPEVIDPEKATAELVAGVLTLKLGKVDRAKPKRIMVQAG